MTKTILSDDIAALFLPSHVAPIVSALASHTTPANITGGVYETGSGWVGQTRWEVQKGSVKSLTNIEDVAASLAKLESAPKSYPKTVEENLALFRQGEPKVNTPETVLANIRQAQAATPQASKFVYAQRDLILYALSVGASHTDLPLVFEGNKNFTPLPVFGLIPFFNAKTHYNMDDIMTKFDQRLLLHVDQFLEIRAPIPLSGTLSTYPKLVQVVDKGKDVLVVQGFTTVDENNKEIFYNETTVLVRGGGGFGGDKQLRDRGPATSNNTPPSRSPDHVVEEKTAVGQAALYRLNGDLNPLHIDPEFSSKGGFKTPILHGLCSLGVAGKHVFQKYGSYRDLRGKFTSPVLPGQTLRTEMWLEKSRVFFQVVVVETGKKAISSAAVTLDSANTARL
jgi:multifunctional beta-oxidation protein